MTYRHDPNRNLYPDSGPPTCIPCNTELYVTGVDGTGEVRLTSGPGAEFWPSWSPDGSRIAFSSTRDDPNPDDCFTTCRSEIYVINADGTGTTRLTSNSADDTKPVWSPDGTKIAFETTRDGNREIYSMNAEGSGQTNLTNDPYEDRLWDWLSAQGPQRGDYKNARQFCKAERDFLGKAVFREQYGQRRALRNCIVQNGGRNAPGTQHQD